MKDLSGKTILITGASRGIGFATAKKLDQENVNLILISRNSDDIQIDSRHLRINADLTNFTDLNNIEKITEKHPIDCIIHSAGVGIYKPIEGLTLNEFEYSIKLNLIAPFTLTKTFLPKLKNSSIGLNMAIGSGAGVIPFAHKSAYCASKFGLRGMMLSLSEEFTDTNIHFCLITLGSTITTFGGKSIEKQEHDLMHNNKAAFPVDWVADKLVNLIKDENRSEEITLYPSEYGFGNWEKPVQ